MNIAMFMKDKWLLLLSQTAVILFLAVFLRAMKVNDNANILVCLCILLVTISALALEYHQKNRFYRQLYQGLQRLDKKYYISSIVGQAWFADGIILTDVLQEASKAMADEVAFYRRMNTEYRDYIETWIHEIKIPISCIDLICGNHKGELATGVMEELSRIDAYVEQALYYARSTNLEKDYIIREIALDDLVKKVLKKYAKQLIAAKTEPSFENLSQRVYGDPKWLEFILGQLISNSIKYRKNGLKLTFSAREEKDRVILSLRDNGSGIAENEIARIFDKGFTGTNGRGKARSTGIGLYLCRKLCDKMHLCIYATSVPGQGTTMHIAFPRDSRLLLED